MQTEINNRRNAIDVKASGSPQVQRISPSGPLLFPKFERATRQPNAITGRLVP